MSDRPGQEKGSDLQEKGSDPQDKGSDRDLRIMLGTAKIRDLQSGAGLAAAGGHCIHEFSQSLEPVHSMICKGSQEGICYQLAVDWIVRSSEAEGLFWRRLCPSGSPDPSYIAELLFKAVSHGSYTFTRPGRTVPTTRRFGDFHDEIGSYLSHRDVKWVEAGGARYIAGDSLISSAVAAIERNYSAKIAKKTHKNFFFLLLLRGDCGHALSLRFRADATVDFFDPNLGEFHFRTMDGLAQWANAGLDQVYHKLGCSLAQVGVISRRGVALTFRQGEE